MEPFLVLEIGKLIAENALAFVLPDCEEVEILLKNFRFRMKQALEDPAQITHGEKVVKLRRRRQHLDSNLHNN